MLLWLSLFPFLSVPGGQCQYPPPCSPALLLLSPLQPKEEPGGKSPMAGAVLSLCFAKLRFYFNDDCLIYSPLLLPGQPQPEVTSEHCL